MGPILGYISKTERKKNLCSLEVPLLRMKLEVA